MPYVTQSLMCKVKLSLLLFIASNASGFNVQDIGRALVFVSNTRGNQFGVSISFHENEDGKWLVVGAPKENLLGTSSGRSNDNEDGAMYTCLFQAEKMKKSTCSKLNLEVVKNEEIIYSCDFEDCFLEQMELDDFDWIRTYSPTPSVGTGPSRDHTSLNTSFSSYGFYMYMEASRGLDEDLMPGKSAMLGTPVQEATLGDCLRFWYHMYGEDIVSLNVYVQTNETGMLMIWNKDGNQGNQWIEGHITIITEYSYKILFEGIKEYWRGDIAIDDIVIWKGQCKEDMRTTGKSLGATLTRNPLTGEILSCAPNWTYNCNGQTHSSGACYLLNGNFTTNTLSILTPCRSQVCSVGKVDLVFAIDGSHSVSDHDFQLIKLWLRNVISSLPISSNYFQVGVLVYTDVANVTFYLSEYKKVEDIRKAINRMRFTGGSTNTGKAINVATEKMLSVGHGMRPDAKHVVIVMTDGKSQDNVNEPSRRAKEKGVTVFAIGVGSANAEELRTISSDPEKFLFTIEDYAALSKIKSTLQESISALESQGRTSTTERGQAGFSAMFYENSAIIAAPGLDDWSGGYSSYYLNKTSSEPLFRVTTTFQNLVRKSKIFLTQQQQKYTRTNSYNITGSTPLEITQKMGANVLSPLPSDKLDRITQTISSFNITSGVRPTNATQTPTNFYREDRSDYSSFDSTSSTLNTPTASSYFVRSYTRKNERLMKNVTSTSRSATMSASWNTINLSEYHEEGSGLSSTKGSSNDESVSEQSNSTQSYLPFATSVDYRVQLKTVNIQTGPETPNEVNTAAEYTSMKDDSSKGFGFSRTKRSFVSTSNHSIQSALAEDAFHKVIGHAYFGYSITSGKFLSINQSDLAFGAPRSLSYGAVFIVRQDIPQGNDNNARIIAQFQSKQLGSYFGYSLCSCDTNGDGIDELVVGAPLWMANHGDEGRVFVYLSAIDEKTGTVERKEIALFGSNQAHARFGFSLASPGDINMDGFEDLIVGAPSIRDGDGSIFIYYGRPDVGIASDSFQQVKASGRKKRPVYFGYSLDASLDVDGNGYNDLAVGCPGNDRVVVLFTRPVIHVDVEFYSRPSVLNLTLPDVHVANDSSACGGNGTKLCTKFIACFKAYGTHIPDDIRISYEVQSDVHLNRERPRGRFVKSNDEIMLITNIRKCHTLILHLKDPIRHQLYPIVTQLSFQLSQSMPLAGKSAVLDIFDAQPKFSNVTFANPCKENICQSDLHLSCSVIHDNADAGTNSITTVKIKHERRLTINLNLANSFDPAYDVELDVYFSPFLYLIQTVPFYPDGKRCVEQNTGIGGLNDDTSNKDDDDDKDANTPRKNNVKLIYKNPVMLGEEKCALKLQFGMQNSYHGGHLNISFRGRSNSVEVNFTDNYCNAEVLVKFQADVFMRGKSEQDPVTFTSTKKNHISLLEDIGPTITHTFSITNAGPSLLPNASVMVQWPTRLPSAHDILYLTNMTCLPRFICQCEYRNLLANPEKVNASGKVVLPVNRGETTVDLGQYGEPELKIDAVTQELFSTAIIDCSKRSRGISCETMHCHVQHFPPLETVHLQLNFRLWKHTFLQAKVWKVQVKSNALVTTKLSPHFVPSNKKMKLDTIFTITTTAFNGNFSQVVEDKTNTTSTLWWLVIILAISGGFLLLLLTILALYKMGFFKSKYKQQIEEELEWTNSYEYTFAKQNQSGVNTTSDPDCTLTTFHRAQSEDVIPL